MSKPTPGPWEVIERTTARHPWSYIINRDRPQVSDEEAEANARLIAAAPELLDAAKGALAEFRKLQAVWADQAPRLGYTTKDSDTVAALAAAIAKAEGR